jgi:hypothetical protein
MTILAMAAPVIAAVFAVILIILVVVFGRKAWRKVRGRKNTPENI